MSSKECEFTISTAKEGLFKGLSTYVQIPTMNLAAKVFYMPSMNKDAIHCVHQCLVECIEENLVMWDSQPRLVIIVNAFLEMLKERGHALQVLKADWFKAEVTLCSMDYHPIMAQGIKNLPYN